MRYLTARPHAWAQGKLWLASVLLTGCISTGGGPHKERIVAQNAPYALFDFTAGPNGTTLAEDDGEPSPAKGGKGKAEPAAALKTGESCGRMIAQLFSFGDNSIETAKVNGGIDTVATVDYRYINIQLFIRFYTQVCTVVRGV